MYNSTKPLTIIDESNRVFELKDICHNTIYREPNDIERLTFPLIDHSDKSSREIPDELDGRVVWNDYLTNLFFQQTSSWNCAVARALSSRFAILTAGEVAPNLSYDYIAFCPEDKLTKPYNYSPDSKNFLDKSTYYGASYLYTYGTTYNPCFEFNGELTKAPHQDCEKLLMKNKNYKCVDDNNIFRFFRASFIANIAPNVKSIKWEISKFGPVAATMNVFEDFNTYNGLSEYKEVKSQKKIGARSVVIVGWIQTKSKEEFWIIDPCIGYSWGVGGYFLCKIGIKELGIEDSVIALYPDFMFFTEYLYKFYSDYKLSDQLTKEREKINADNKFFFIKDTITKENIQKIKESFTYINIKYLPKYDTFFAKDIGDIPATVIKKKPGFNLYYFIAFTVVFIALLYFLIRMKK